jgi:hypothetical protein
MEPALGHQRTTLGGLVGSVEWRRFGVAALGGESGDQDGCPPVDGAHLSPGGEKHKNCPVHNRERDPHSKWQVKRAGGADRVFADELNGTELADHLARKRKQLRQAEERGDEQRVERLERRLAILEEEAQRRAPGGG